MERLWNPGKCTVCMCRLEIAAVIKSNVVAFATTGKFRPRSSGCMPLSHKCNKFSIPSGSRHVRNVPERSRKEERAEVTFDDRPASRSGSQDRDPTVRERVPTPHTRSLGTPRQQVDASARSKLN